MISTLNISSFIPFGQDMSFEDNLRAYVQEYIIHITSIGSMYRPEYSITQEDIDSIYTNRVNTYGWNFTVTLRHINTMTDCLTDSINSEDFTVDYKPSVYIHTINTNSDSKAFVITTKEYQFVTENYLVANALASYFMFQ